MQGRAALNSDGSANFLALSVFERNLTDLATRAATMVFLTLLVLQ